ncbi:Sugar transport protein 10-like protein [Drosera capensis]
MAGGPFAYNRNVSTGSSHGGNGGGARLTLQVLITCIVAASGGLIFGYDIGISGPASIFPLKRSNVTPMVPFLEKFFPQPNHGQHGKKVHHDVSAASPSSVVATPLYLAEVAPPKWRGAFNTGFHLFIGIGVLVASTINYFTAKLHNGWRLSLASAVFPSLIMLIGGCFISDSPNSLVERGKLEEARQVLVRIRGRDEVEEEITELVKVSDAAKAASQVPLITIFQRQYRAHLIMALAISFFQQISGIFIIAFYAPALFQMVGAGAESGFIAAIVLGIDNISLQLQILFFHI